MLDYYSFAFDAFSTIHPRQVGLYDIVRLCHRHIEFVSYALKFEPPKGEGASPELLSNRRRESQWAPCVRAVRHYHHVEGWKAKPEQLARLPPPTQEPEEVRKEDTTLAGECLTMIAECDEWTAENVVGARLTAFPDELIEALALFIPPEDRSKYSRLQAIDPRQGVEGGLPRGFVAGGMGRVQGPGPVGRPRQDRSPWPVQGPGSFRGPGPMMGPGFVGGVELSGGTEVSREEEGFSRGL